MRALARAAAALGWIVLAGAPAHAQSATPGYPVAEGYVVDTALALGPESESALEEELRLYEGRTRNQIAVAVVPTLGDLTIEDYATGLFNTWGVGQATEDNGVLLVVATEDRKLRIEVGEGLLDELSDSEAQSIVESEILPRLRSGDIEGGVRAGTIGVRRSLGDDVSTPDTGADATRPARERDPSFYNVRDPSFDTVAGDSSFERGEDYPGERFTIGSILMLVIPVALVGIVLTRFAGGSDRCPNCSRALAWGGSARRGGFDHCETCGFARQRGLMGGVGFGGALLGGLLLGSAQGARGSRDHTGDWGAGSGFSSSPSASGGGGSPFGGGSSGGGGASGSW
ncbi:MAG TPA: TPM domain-containing protein [Acidimicrobiales bacterium]|nr:TPM domain-containing protein [Acidimicrobiales bacterium]